MVQVTRFLGQAFQNSLGIKVTKATNLATASPINMFTVTGKVLITLIHGEVTTVLATTTTIKFRRETGTVDMCAATTITSDGAGTMYIYSGDRGAVLNCTLAATDVPVVGFADLAGGPISPVVFGLAGASETIELVTDQAGTGVITWGLFYIPLEVGAKVVAA